VASFGGDPRFGPDPDKLVIPLAFEVHMEGRPGKWVEGSIQLVGLDFPIMSREWYLSDISVGKESDFTLEHLAREIVWDFSTALERVIDNQHHHREEAD
jgi:hypothetical protein